MWEKKFHLKKKNSSPHQKKTYLQGNASAISRSLAYSSSLTTKDEIDDTFTRILVDQSVFSESSPKVTFDESLPIEITGIDPIFS